MTTFPDTQSLASALMATVPPPRETLAENSFPLGRALISSNVLTDKVVCNPGLPVLQTLWTLPCDKGLGWLDLESALCAWSVSAHLLKRHYSEVTLMTDSAGSAVAQRLALPYTSIRAHLTNVNRKDLMGLPSLGRILSLAQGSHISLSSFRFIHVDWSTMLLQPLNYFWTSGNYAVEYPQTMWFLTDAESYQLSVSALSVINHLGLPAGLTIEDVLQETRYYATGVTLGDLGVSTVARNLYDWLYHQPPGQLDKLTGSPSAFIEKFLLPLMVRKLGRGYPRLLCSAETSGPENGCSHVSFIGKSRQNPTACRELKDYTARMFPRAYELVIREIQR